MLVLARKKGEEIVLPECDVTIRVLDIGKSKVRLGVVAPDGTVVHRMEVWKRICPPQRPGVEGAFLAPAVTADEEAESRAPVARANDLDVPLADWIARRIGKPLPSLSVEMTGDGMLVSGCAG